MAGANQQVITDVSRWGQPFWLPPGGWDNGLTDDSWAEIAEVTSDLAADLILFRLRDAGVPGYAAHVHRRPSGRGRSHKGADQRVRIWAGCHAYGRGESALLSYLPNLVRQLGPEVLA